MTAARSRVREYADVALLAGLIVAIATFGRPFTKVGLDSANIYISEVLLVLIAAATLARHGLRPAWSLLRERLPWIPLLAFWLIGAWALARGLADYSVKLVSYDVAMLEYSVLIPLIALVVDTRQRLAWLLGAVAVGGGVTVVLGLVDWFVGDRIWPPDRASPSPALTLYAILLVVWVATRLAQRAPMSPWLVPLAFGALLLIGVEERRSAWLGVIVALLFVAALAPTRRGKLTTGAAAVAAIAVATAISIPLSSAGTIGPDQPPAAGTAPDAPNPNAIDEVTSVVSGGGSEESQNVRWRLAIWKHTLEESADHPFVGVGFGEPTNFEWHDRRYDLRTGDPRESFDVTGPHNDYLHFVQRMGWLGLIAALAIIAVAVRRVWPWVRQAASADRDRTLVATGIAMLAAVAAMAGFNDALKTPYMGPFFWILIGLLLVVPYVLRRPADAVGSDDGLDRADVQMPADPALEGAGGARRG